MTSYAILKQRTIALDTAIRTHTRITEKKNLLAAQAGEEAADALAHVVEWLETARKREEGT